MSPRNLPSNSIKATRPRPEPPANADDPEESRRFIDMAREAEADESPGALDRAFKKVIGQQKPKDEPTKPRRRAARSGDK